MCGILFVASRSGTNTPSFIPKLSKKSSCEFEYNVWDTNDSATIQSFIDQGIEKLVKPLSETDQKKLKNLDTLRHLNLELIKVKNNVKLPKEQVREQAALIQSRIDEVVGLDANTPIQEPETTAKCQIDTSQELMFGIASRGPDYINYQEYSQLNCNFQLFSSVLSLRQPFQEQPVHFSNLVLQFNGELYNEECLSSNDTTFIQDLILKSEQDMNSILNAICQLKGEFAFVLHDLKRNLVYFGRDSVGKRSLVYSTQNNQLLISSISDASPTIPSQFIECNNEIKVYDLSSNNMLSYKYEDLHAKFNLRSLKRNPKSYKSTTPSSNLQSLYKLIKSNTLVRQQAINPISSNDRQESKPLLGVLFSGGLDCTIIASLICENILDQNSSSCSHIDLLTVGFDNPRTNQMSFDSPDRKLSKKSWFNLASKYNKKEVLDVRLVEINVPYEQWLMHKERVVSLMYPCNTEMDLSIAIAFYFASSTLEELTSIITLSDDHEIMQLSYEEFLSQESKFTTVDWNYLSSAKVLFSGLGADELFAGYSRHESIFTNQLNPDSGVEEIGACYDELSAELIHDIDIIHRRNLGRDDRVISCWGKELRYPYLDEELISFVINEIEPSSKFSFTFEEFVGKKKNAVPKIIMKPIRKHLLRELAGYLGLDWVKFELKRAIQFGAKSAKLEIGQSKIKGTDSL